MVSFWCMCTVTHVSRLVRWLRVRSGRSVRATISLSRASAFFMALVMLALSVLEATSAACAHAAAG